MNHNLDKYLLTAIHAAIDAGNEILEVYGSDDFLIENKSDNSPVTIADKRAHDLIVKALDPLNIPVLSEEGKELPASERQKWNTLWIVDPLDGTKEFIKRNGEFTVNIALVGNGKPILGVLLVPVKQTLYFSSQDIGSFKIEIKSGIKNLSLDEIIKNAERLIVENPGDSHFQTNPYRIVGSRSHLTAEVEAFVNKQKEVYPDVSFVSAGSSLKFCLIAEGKADIYPRLGPTMEWDTAAGQAIVEHAGGSVIRHDTNTPLGYNKGNLLNPWFIVR